MAIAGAKRAQLTLIWWSLFPSYNGGQGDVAAYELDVTQTAAVEAAVAATVDRFGRLDVLVNVAGFPDALPAAQLTDEVWSAVLDVHLNGTFRCCRAAYPVLCRSDAPAIVNISSIAARMSMTSAVYSSAKSGIEGLTRSLAVEWAPAGIRVNAVAPGYTRTRLVEAAIAAGRMDEAHVTSLVPMRRLAEPSEIATAVYFLASEAASYVTGQTLDVDGGTLIDSHLARPAP
jgi:3-oxoacyl-[acyl-carrier protein] reductase